MPELPEVEVICRGLRPHLIGRTIVAVQHSGKSLRQPVPIRAMEKALIDNTFTGVERRAKYLQFSLKSGGMMIIHLGMTGNLGIFEPSVQHAKHDHVIWTLDNNSELRYNDTRRFGSINLIAKEHTATREETFFKNSGPEPFSNDFSAQYLHSSAKGKNLAVKNFIMTNKVVVGIGNIYANESLFAAGIRPSRKIKSLSLAKWAGLVTEIRKVLEHAITCGGSTISDYLNASQQKGYFQMNFKVYGRDGQPCSSCSTTILKKDIAGRASFFCTTCQK